mgnify:FL=1
MTFNEYDEDIEPCDDVDQYGDEDDDDEDEDYDYEDDEDAEELVLRSYNKGYRTAFFSFGVSALIYYLGLYATDVLLGLA